jgi:uncharacterized membrane protein YhaH (DUF805 family)
MEPLYDASPVQAVRRFWLKYAVFSGRAGRAEYWWWALVSFVVVLLLEAIRFVALGATLATYVASPVLSLRWASVPWLAWFVVTFVPAQALAVRRLHDSGRSGWWQLLALVVIVLSNVQTRLLPPTNPLEPGARPLTGVDLAITTSASIVTLIISVVLIILYAAAPARDGQRYERPRVA